MQRSNSNATSSGAATMAWDGAHCPTEWSA